MREALEEHRVQGELLIIGDGEKAIRYIQALDLRDARCPDLIIIDLNLPKKSGREVLDAIRKSTTCRKATAVILSSSDAPRDKAEALELGASQYIRKPLRLEEFLALGAVFKAMLGG